MKVFGEEFGEPTRQTLMRLYERQPDRFVAAIASIERGEGKTVITALAAWAEEVDQHLASAPTRFTSADPWES